CGHKSDVERTDTRCSVVQDAVAIPAVLHRAKLKRGFGGERSNSSTVAPRKCSRADDDHQPLRLAHRVRKRMPADRSERLGSGADVIVGVGQIRLGSDYSDWEFARAPTLANARIEDGSFFARIGADNQQRVGTVDPRYCRIE